MDIHVEQQTLNRYMLELTGGGFISRSDKG